LFCRRGDGGFTSREHIVPESLGNDRLILPVGVVCDRCNTRCSRLDRALCEFSPIRLMKTVSSVPSKKGKLPRLEFDNGTLTCESPGEISLRLDDEESWHDLPAPPGQKAFSFTGESSRDATVDRAALIHRALVKQALELVWLDHSERALSSDFDRERELVLRGGHHGYLVVPKQIDLNAVGTEVDYVTTTRASDGAPLVFVSGRYLGIPVATDTLFPGPVNDVTEEFNVFVF
jgi:hypothetical protein